MATYATLSLFKAYLEKTDTADDGMLSQLLGASSTAIDRYCKRPDGFIAVSTASARYYVGSGKAYQMIDECTTVTAVAVKDSIDDTTYTSWASTDYDKAAGSVATPDFNRTPYTVLFCKPDGDYSTFTSGHMGHIHAPTVSVTATWGYATYCPDEIETACMMQAARWWKRLQGAMADSLASPDMGTLMYLKQLDPDVQQILIGGGYVALSRSFA
jgi:hypothetical protein